MTPRFQRVALATVLVLGGAACGSDEGGSAVDIAETAVAPSTADGTGPTETSDVTSAVDSAAPVDSEVAEEESDPDEPITITFESYTYGTDRGGPGTQMLIDEFEELHPNITVEPIGTPSGDIHVSVAAKAAAGNPPDVAQIGWSKFSFVLENLPYVPVEEIAGDEWDDHVAGMTPDAVEIGAHDGEIVGLPSILSIPTMFYNADLFQAAGLDPDDPPDTWSEVKSAGLAVATAGGAEGAYVAVVDPAKSDYLTQSLIYSNGGSFLNDDGSVGFDDELGVEALTTMQDLTTSGAQPAVASGDALALFQAGDLGMLVISSSVLDLLVDSATDNFDIRSAPMPGFDDKPPRPTTSGAGLFVFSDDEAHQHAAWEFVKFLTSERGFTIVASEIGYLPLRPSIVDDPDGLGRYLDQNPLLQATIDQLDSIEPYEDLPGPDATRAREILQDEIVEPIVLGGADPATTMSDGASRIADLLP